MKKLLLSIVLFFVILYGLPAQEQAIQSSLSDMSIEEKAESITSALGEQIDLTKEQHADLLQTWTEYFTDTEEQQLNQREKRFSSRKALLKLEQERDLKIKGILNEPQYTQYEEFMKNEKLSRGNRF